MRSSLAVVLLGLVAAGCSDAAPAAQPEPTAEITFSTPEPPPPPPTTTTTTTLGQPPRIDVMSPLDLEIPLSGPPRRAATLEIDVSDPEGGAVTVDVDGPPELVGLSDGSWEWQPAEPSSAIATVTATDETGLQTRVEVELRARHPQRSALVAVGDSVPSGRGLDLFDYVRPDPCFRAAGDGYPRRLFDRLVAAEVLPLDAELAVVACSGADVGDLMATAVDGGLDGTGREGVDELPQLEWVIRANPSIVTITVGANDLGFIFPGRLLEEGGTPSPDRVGPRLESLGERLSALLAEVVAKTDAIVAVTTYYNPTAGRPQGVEGCEEACFLEGTEEVLTQLNTTIADAAAPHGERVVVVDLQERFVDHGAPNGFGPDGARAGLGVLGDVLGPVFAGIQPYCAKGDSGPDPWVNSLDCVHPNNRGAAEIAAAIAVELGA